MRKRSFVSIAAALALGLTAISVPAYAQGAGPRLAKGQKVCRSKMPNGKVKRWTCGASQPCCVNHTFNLYTCGSQLLQCL